MEKQEICPNPNGETGICYDFDRHRDRTGCLGCSLFNTIPHHTEDPLPGLTKMIKEQQDRKKEIENQEIIDKYRTDLIKSDINEGYYNERFKTFVHYGIDGRPMDCCPISYKYILQLEALIKNISEHIKISRGNINEREEFYKSNQVNKDDFASELHLLMTCDLFLTDLEFLIKDGFNANK